MKEELNRKIMKSESMYDFYKEETLLLHEENEKLKQEIEKLKKKLENKNKKELD